jgi:hypothetical protein
MNFLPVSAKRIPVKKSNLAGLLAFGTTNLGPQTILDVCADSVTAGACLSVRAEFIEGNGFYARELAKMVIHRSGMTLDKALNRTAWNMAVFEAIAFHVGYNGFGKIAFIRPIPVEYIRLGVPDDMGIITHAAICPYLDGGYNASKKNLFTKLPLFNPDPMVVLEQIAEAGGIDNYEGQIIYEPMWAPGDSYYHQPSYLPAFFDIQSEGELSMFDFKSVINGFNIAGILSVLAKPGQATNSYDPNLDPNSIESQISNNQGAQNTNKVWIHRAQTQQELEAMKFIDVTGAGLADRYISTVDRVENRITRAMRVPNELVNIRRNGGLAPTGEEIKISSQLMYQTVNRYQRHISELFTVILRNWKTPVTLDEREPCKIENLNYFPEPKTAEQAPATPEEATAPTETVTEAVPA